jgi:hypothetical protein
MVSWLQRRTSKERLKKLELTMLEEMWHTVRTFKILQGLNEVKKEQWYTLAASSMVNTRQVEGPLNLLKPRTDLE